MIKSSASSSALQMASVKLPYTPWPPYYMYTSVFFPRFLLAWSSSVSSLKICANSCQLTSSYRLMSLAPRRQLTPASAYCRSYSSVYRFENFRNSCCLRVKYKFPFIIVMTIMSVGSNLVLFSSGSFFCSSNSFSTSLVCSGVKNYCMLAVRRFSS